MNELGNVVARGQADVNGVIRTSTLVIIFEPLPQCMGSDADNGVHLRIKGFRPPQGPHGDAVLLNLIDSTLEVFFADKIQKPNKIIRPTDHSGSQDGFQFSPLSLKPADCRWQAVILST
jgi:hypothetical protein